MATVKLLAFLLAALALLVCDTAAGLASGLAGGLALAAATVLCALAKVLGLKGLDVFHIEHLRKIFASRILSYLCALVKRKRKKRTSFGKKEESTLKFACIGKRPISVRSHGKGAREGKICRS